MSDFTLSERFKAKFIGDIWIVSKFSRVWFREQWHVVATIKEERDGFHASCLQPNLPVQVFPTPQEAATFISGKA